MNLFTCSLKKTAAFFVLILTLLSSATYCRSQVTYGTEDSLYLQNFDQLPSSSSGFTWTNNQTLTGWYAASSASAGFTSLGSTGSSTTGALYSFGSSGSTDRALGSIGSGTVGNFYWGLALTNTTGKTLNSFSLAYTGEQWRNSAAGAQAINVEFSLGATALRTGTYNPLDQLTFVSPVTAGTAGAINGNAAGSRQTFTGQTVDNLQWLAGQTLWLRWLDPDHTGTDHGLAIDDVRFSAQSFEPPAGYYNSASNLTGVSLLDALHAIIRNHTIIALDTGNPNTVAALSFLDADPADSSKVQLIYGTSKVAASSFAATSGWVRESLWPAARGVGNSGADASDLFNLRPISPAVFAARNNRFFDVSDVSASSYLSPAHAEAAPSSSLDADSWEPPKNQRGDIARALFYMDVRYDGGLATDPNTTDLVLENSLGNPSDMAVLRTLLVWHEMDPVDDSERLRNGRIYRLYQHNRNPFIDHPEYAEALYASGPNAAAAPTDVDLDGMEDAWERVFHLDPTTPGDAALDTDEDGFTNGEEAWMGSDPSDAASPVTLIVDGSYTGTLELGTRVSPYKTIQAAIDAAPVNERRAILVAPGSYEERPDISNHRELHLFSMSGASYTVIEGQQVDSSVVRFNDFQRASLVGFTVRNGYTSWRGAGLRAISTTGNILISENTFENNVCTYFSDNNGGGGGLYLEVGSGSLVTNNLIFNNTAQRGGGVLFAQGNVRFYHNTVAGNTATDSAMGGGLSALSNVVPDVRNCIVWSNYAAASLDQVQGMTLFGNLVQGGGSANITADPSFVSNSLPDYHIRSNSPARFAATNLPVVCDTDGEIRSSNNRDMGADQYQDSDGDGLPNYWEDVYGFNPADPTDATNAAANDGAAALPLYNAGNNPLVSPSMGQFRAVAGDKSVDLYWQGNSNSNSITTYSISRWVGSVSWITQRPSRDTGATSFHDPQANEAPLVSGQIYYYKLYAASRPKPTPNRPRAWCILPVNVGGVISATLPPAAPTGVSATSGDAQVNLRWTASFGASSYKVRRSTTSGSGYTDFPGNVVTAPAVTLNNTGLISGTTYYYVVTASNAGGSSANSVQASATPVISLIAPTGLTAIPGNEQVILSWTASNGATGYKVQRSTTSGSGYADFPSNIVTAPIVTLTNTGLINGTTYYYVVAASNTGGNSSISDQVEVTPIDPDTEPDSLPDAWELQYFGNLTHFPSVDEDGDGLTNLQEYQQGLNPNDFYNGFAPRLDIASGGNQRGAPGVTLPIPLRVVVDNGASNAPVTLTVKSGNALLSNGTFPPSKSVQVRSTSQFINPQGWAQYVAEAQIRLPNIVGDLSVVEVTAGGAGSTVSITTTASTTDPSMQPPQNFTAVPSSATTAHLSWSPSNSAKPTTLEISNNQGATWSLVQTMEAGINEAEIENLIPQKTVLFRLYTGDDSVTGGTP